MNTKPDLVRRYAHNPILTKADIPYGSHPHQLLDLYLPPQGKSPFPVVVWFGGLWAPSKGAPTHAFLPAGCAAKKKREEEKKTRG